MYWSQFLDTRTFGAGEDVAELCSWNMNLHVEQMAAQRRVLRLDPSLGSDFRQLLVGQSPDGSLTPGQRLALQIIDAGAASGQRRAVAQAPAWAPARSAPRRASAPAVRSAPRPARSPAAARSDLEARLASKEADIDVLKAQVMSLNMAMEASRQQTSVGVAASLEALEPRSLAATELAALRVALPRAVAAVESEVSRRLVAAEATNSGAREVHENESLCVCCLDRPRDIVFLSCMHVVVCEQCAPRTAACPLCRVPISEKRRVFR